MGGEQLGLQLAQLAAFLRQRALHRLALGRGFTQELRSGITFRLEGREKFVGVADGSLADFLGEADGLLACGLQRLVLLATSLDRRVEGRPRPCKLFALLGDLHVLEGEVRLQAL